MLEEAEIKQGYICSSEKFKSLACKALVAVEEHISSMGTPAVKLLFLALLGNVDKRYVDRNIFYL